MAAPVILGTGVWASVPAPTVAGAEAATVVVKSGAEIVTRATSSAPWSATVGV